ncbi:MAG: glycosyltransferase [Planctomycetes bacterium]|nr:glycosyltransferase [Planctomycetota bacterium]
MTPDVTVVVPVHDGAAFLAETLDSVLAQRGATFEVVVVDDGSKDATPEVLARYAGAVRVVRQECRGVSAARNRGAAEGRGRVLAFLDQDDAWEPGLLAALLPELDRHAEWSLVHADSWVVDARGRAHGRRGRFLRSRTGFGFAELCLRNAVPIESMLVRRASFERAGGFDPELRYLEDWDLALRLSRTGSIGFVDRPLARYRVHARNLSHALEPMLVEELDLHARVRTRCAPLSVAERAALALADVRVALDLAWQALRRGDLPAARTWRARAAELGRAGGARAFAARRARIALLAVLLELDARGLDPVGLGDLARALLPRRRLYGLLPNDLECVERIEP